jgi:hypothetical protein
MSKSSTSPVSENTTPDEDLTSRVLPQMKLSNGDLHSLTPPPRMLSDKLAPRERANARFQVEGNAM